MNLLIGQCTLVGNYRENNEDAIAVQRFGPHTVCVVADGMGGHAAGEIASRRAIEVVGRELGKTLPQARADDQTQQAIREAVVQANEEILAMAALDRDLKNMGTTIAMGVWRNNRELHLAHVGDSRVYLIRDGRIQRLTTDHSFLQALLDVGALTPEEAAHFRGRNYLMRYLGSRDTSATGPDLRLLAVEDGDRYLLCSDGLTEKVADKGLLECSLDTRDVQQCAEALGRLALENGSRDNVSCIVVEVVRKRAGQGQLETTR
jgi:serine/threonine protein phosphatase PrpC